MTPTAAHDHLNDTTYISERFSECTRCGALIDWHDDEDAEPGMPEDGSAEFSANELRIADEEEAERELAAAAAAALYRVAAARKAEREELVAEGNLPAAAMAGKDERQARRDATIMDGSLLEELRDRVDRLLDSRAFGAAAQVEEQLRGALARRRELLADLAELA